MKISLLPSLILAMSLTLAGCGKSNQTPGSNGSGISGGEVQPARQTSFGEVTSQLDPGGTVYGYLSTDQWLAGLSTNVAKLRDLLLEIPEASDSADREQVKQAFDLIADTITKSGVEQLTGVGLSGVQISPELFRTKLILHHARGQGDGLFWNFMGHKPHELAGLDLLPKQTALAAFGDVDLMAVWDTIEAECATVPELAKGLKRWQLEFEQGTSLKWKDVLKSLGGEVGAVFTLDEANLIDVPFVEGLQVPEPGLLFAVKVKNDLLYDRISSELKKNTMVQLTDEKGLKMCAMPIPLPLPVRLEITVARSGDYLFVATTSQLVRNVLAVRDGKEPGARKSPEFATLLKYLPTKGNQFFYADKKFSGSFLKLQQQFVESGMLKPEHTQILQKLFLTQKPTYGLSIGAHTATGWQSVAVGNQDSATAVVGAAAVLPAGLLASIAVPNFVKARATAQQNGCVSQLHTIDNAKQQWALENNKPENATPTERDLAEYLPGRKLPKCPQGGRYTIGRVSVLPKCSHSGHVLND
jgi:competence protein ComGC